MTGWNSQHYRKEGIEKGIQAEILDNALATAKITTKYNASAPPIFTLGHLAFLAGSDYEFLRLVASRNDERSYRTFHIRKRPSRAGERRYRTIAVPCRSLMQVQRWITQTVLAKVQPHSASVGFSKGNKLKIAAQAHADCRWLIKMDILNFFESINEISVYRVFRSLGYQPLVSFEMARICTRIGGASKLHNTNRWQVRERIPASEIRSYDNPKMGHLPQGAPTSPMLANLAVREFDTHIAIIAAKHKLTYTRYADDITLSSKAKNFDRELCSTIIGEVFSAMGEFGLSPNVTKTRISSPGSRKVVLGLIVNGAAPNLSRDFKSNLRRHIYYLTNKKFGPVHHARERGFSSILGLKHHVQGLISFARQIDQNYADKCSSQLANVDWPL